jgi:hypothetical protein
VDIPVEKQVVARAESFRENHSEEAIEKAILEAQKLDSRESAVTVDILTALQTGQL